MTSSQPPSFWRGRSGWVLLGFLAVAGYFLLVEHAAHVAGILPYLLLLACPLMHMFMHRGHSGNHGNDAGSRPRSEDRP